MKLMLELLPEPLKHKWLASGDRRFENVMRNVSF